MNSRPRLPLRCRPVTWAALGMAGRWLILMALWLQVALAPIVGAMAATPSAWQAQLDGKMVICTAAGMVVLDGDGKAVPQQEAGPSCVFCLPLLHGGAKAPPLVAEPLPCRAPVLETLIGTEQPRLVLTPYAGGPSPRAPPAL